MDTRPIVPQLEYDAAETNDSAAQTQTQREEQLQTVQVESELEELPVEKIRTYFSVSLVSFWFCACLGCFAVVHSSAARVARARLLRERAKHHALLAFRWSVSAIFIGCVLLLALVIISVQLAQHLSSHPDPDP